MLHLILCWLILELLGLLALPIVYPLLRPLTDGGYAFAKTLGVLLGAYLFWLLVVLGLLPNNPPALGVALTPVIILSLTAARRALKLLPLDILPTLADYCPTLTPLLPHLQAHCQTTSSQEHPIESPFAEPDSPATFRPRSNNMRPRGAPHAHLGRTQGRGGDGPPVYPRTACVLCGHGDVVWSW